MRTVDDRDALTRRIELLAAASVDEPEGEGAAVAALVGALRAEIGSVRAELGSLRSETGAVRGDLDALGGRLTGSVAASRSETGILVRRVAELSTRLDGVGGRVDDVRNGLPSLSRELRDGLEQVPVRTGHRLDALTAELTEAVASRIDGVAAELTREMAAGLDRESRNTADTRAAMEDIRGALESRLAVLEDSLAGLSERLEALALDGASTTTEQLTVLATRVDQLDERIAEEGRDSAELLVGRLRDVTETRLSELEETLYDRLSGVLRTRNDELRLEVLGALDLARDDARQDRQAVAELAVTMRGALDGFGTALDRSLTGLGGVVGAALAEGREETQSELDALTEHFGAAISGLRGDLERRDHTAAGRVAALQAALEAKLDQVRAQVATAVTVVRSDVATEVGTLAPRVDELVVAGTAVSESLRALRTEVVGTVEELRDRFVTVNTDSTEVLRGAMTETRAEVAEITRSLREDLLERIEEKYVVVAGRLSELAGTVTGTTAASRESAERLDALAGVLDQTRGSLSEVRAAVEQRLEAMGSAVEGRIRELESALATRLAQVVAAVGADTASTREAAERITALSALAERQGEEIATSLDAVRDDVVDAARDLRKELLLRTSEQIAGLTGHLVELDGTSAGMVQILGGLDAAVNRNTAAGEQAGAGLTSVHDVMAGLNETIAGFRAEWPTRTFEVVEGAKAVAEGVVREVRSEVQAQLAQVRQELSRAVGGVSEASSGLSSGTDRLARAGAVLVEYLEQRDRLLEAERDRVLEEVLDAFTDGLPAKDRAALAVRVGDAAARRRDTRDAERYRTAVGKPVPPVVDDLPETVRELAPAEPEPAAAPASPRAPAASGRARSAGGTGAVPRTAAPATRSATPTRSGSAGKAVPAKGRASQAGSAAASPRPKAATAPKAGPTARTRPVGAGSATKAGSAAGRGSGTKPGPAAKAGPALRAGTGKPLRASAASGQPATRARAATSASARLGPAAGRSAAATPPPARSAPARPAPARSAPARSAPARSAPARSARPVPARPVPADAGHRSSVPSKPSPRSAATRVPSGRPGGRVGAPDPDEVVTVTKVPDRFESRRTLPAKPVPSRAAGPPAARAAAPGAAARRGRLGEMPRVPGPQRALDAAAPPPVRPPAVPPSLPPPRPGLAQRQPDPAQTSWASRSGNAVEPDDDDDDEDVSLRALFRRRR